MCCILGQVKKKLVYHLDFFKEQGGPCYLLFDFFTISFEDGRHVLDAQWLIK